MYCDFRRNMYLFFINCVTLTLLSLLGLGHAQTWLNEYHGNLTFTCPDGQVISRLESEHSDTFQDRRWYAECSTPAIGKATNCYWNGVGYVNDWDDMMLYQCPENKVLSGIAGISNNHFKDRRYKFYCCEIPGSVAHSCWYTDYQNDLNKMMDFKVPFGWAIKGAFSHHRNQPIEDRRFKFNVCKLDILSCKE